jgi:hypothetical protein
MYFVSKPIVTNGLIASLDAGNTLSYTSGSNIWRDLSGNSNTGSLINSPSYAAINNGAIALNGTNNYAALTSNLRQTGSQTISIWFNPDTWTNGGAFTGGLLGGFCFGGDTQNGGISIARFTSYNYINVEAYNSTQRLERTVSIPQTGSWHNITLTYNRDIATFNVYVNSILRTSGVFSTVPSDISWSSYPFLIGACNVNGLVYFQGKLGNVSVYNRALSLSEIQQNFNALKGRYGI